jgi:uncharacterized DUF497 family protein
MHIEIEWDPAKAASNLKKHGVGFDEASTALLDPNALAQPDATSTSEDRWLLVGMSSRARLVTLIYTLRGEGRVRLISARKATRKEAAFYA